MMRIIEKMNARIWLKMAMMGVFGKPIVKMRRTQETIQTGTLLVYNQSSINYKLSYITENNQLKKVRCKCD